MTNDLQDTSLAIGGLMARVERLEEDVSEIRKDQKEMLRILHNAEGSWKTLVAIGGLGVVVGTILGGVFQFWANIKAIFIK